MKVVKLLQYSFLLTTIFLSCINNTKAQNKDINNNQTMTSFTDNGIAAPKEWFTGTVWLNMNVKPDEGYNANIGTVTFETKARTNWHSHTSGQILFVIEGIGYYQEKGKAIQVIKNGDVVKIPKGVKHWHGASHNGSMRHIAMITDYDKDKTEWFEPVSDAEYNTIQPIENEALINMTHEAERNHKELWPEYVSMAKQTDPELVTVFDNFAFDEVLKHNNMPVKERTLLLMASAIGGNSQVEFKMFLNAALNVGATPVETKEILYQAVPYAGMNRVADFLYTMNEIFNERGIELPLESQAVSNPDTRMKVGSDLMNFLTGNNVQKMRDDSPKDLLHIQDYLAGNCFGDFVSRSGLDIKFREKVTLTLLISMGGAESQVKGHIAINNRVGNSRQEMIDVITQLLPYIGYPRTLNALTCLNEVLPYK
jgi:4-carboxymuconolactone decarboxylase